MVYVPSVYRGEASAEELKRYLEYELMAISRNFSETVALELRPIHAEPPKPREGMVVFADGTDWNPGAGKGVYTFLTGAWSKL